MAANPHVYKDLLIFLVAAGVLAPLFNRIRVNAILGFLVAGALLGPKGLGRLASAVPGLHWVTFGATSELATLAELGVVFLLFMIGLELSWERIQTMRRLVFGLGFAQVASCAVLIGGSAVMLGAPPAAAAVIGGATSLSSTALVLPALAARRRLTSTAGRAALAVLLAQDLAAAPMLVAVGLSAKLHGALTWAAALIPLSVAAVALMAIVAAGRLLLRPLFHSAARARSSESFVALSLLIVVGAAGAAAAGGLSMALGAFVAGLLLAETEFRREVEVVIDPFKGLLLGAFFVSAGADLNIDRLLTEPVLIVGVIVAIVVLKFVLTFGLARLFRLSGAAGAEAAAPLGPPGEFAFVVIAQALAAGLVSPDLADIVLVGSGLGLFLIPALTVLGSRLAAVARTPAPEAPEAIPSGQEPEGGRVLIVGYGRVGRLVGAMLRVHDIEFTAVDAEPQVVALARAEGVRIYFGDASREAFLKACGVESTRAVVVTMDAPAKVDEVVRTVRALRPGLALIARARDARHAEALYRLGVTDAVPEAIEASLQLAENTLVDLGVPMGLVIASIHEKRDEYRERFSRSAARERPVRSFSRSGRASTAKPERL
jgi:CPA2 family monovalent cation:H+ antiporter-2